MKVLTLTASISTIAQSFLTTAGTEGKRPIVGIHASITSVVTTCAIRGDRVALPVIKIAAGAAFCFCRTAHIVRAAAIAVGRVSTSEEPA
jgi:hypothetical protein